MRFRSVRAVAALALAFGVLGSSNSAAQMSPAQRVELAPDGEPIRATSLAAQPVTVFLKMAGDPVAVSGAGPRASSSPRPSDGPSPPACAKSRTRSLR